jgi:HTH-type transcriptional regulator, sugar sensing transcriptional regulator
MSLHHALELLGLGHIEALSYAYLAGNPSSTGYRVARGIGKPTANVYRALETLERKGLVAHDRGTPPAYRALPPADMLALLEREFMERKALAARELADLRRETDDEKLYALKSRDQVLSRAHVMLAAARKVALVEAPTAVIDHLVGAVDDARSRGVRVLVLNDGKIAPPHPDVTSDSRRPITTIRMAADAREALIAALPEAGDGVREAVWTRSALIARMLHDALVCEIFYGLVERSLEDGVSAEEVETAFDRCRKIRETA